MQVFNKQINLAKNHTSIALRKKAIDVCETNTSNDIRVCKNPNYITILKQANGVDKTNHLPAICNFHREQKIALYGPTFLDSNLSMQPSTLRQLLQSYQESYTSFISQLSTAIDHLSHGVVLCCTMFNIFLRQNWLLTWLKRTNKFIINTQTLWIL